MSAFEIQLTSASRKLFDRLVRRLDPERLIAGLAQELRRQAEFAVGYTVQTQFGQGQNLQHRAGHLARAIASKVDVRSGEIIIRMGIFEGPALAYAGILERGGEIRPVNARALAVPTKKPGSFVRAPEGSGEALTPAGVSRFPSPRQFPGELIFLPFGEDGFARGNVIGGLFSEAELSRRRRDPRPAYLLMARVKIDAHRYLEKGLEGYLPQLLDGIEEHLREVLVNA